MADTPQDSVKVSEVDTTPVAETVYENVQERLRDAR
jgi:hypothetical protein